MLLVGGLGLYEDYKWASSTSESNKPMSSHKKIGWCSCRKEPIPNCKLPGRYDKSIISPLSGGVTFFHLITMFKSVLSPETCFRKEMIVIVPDLR